MTRLGICSTCKHVEFCVEKQNWRGPIMFCEEFENVAFIPSVQASVQTTLRENEKEPLLVHDRRGICVNCKNQMNCAFPIPIGGVWHCEEYK